MLDILFSNQSIERILLFLFVNQEGYGSQIQHLLSVPLTPLQHALSKLERGGVIESSSVKNKRVYKLNSNYPLAFELETLLKKAFFLLPKEEKRKYCFAFKPKLTAKEEASQNLLQQKELKHFFKRLSKVETLSIHSETKKGSQVEIKKGHALVLISSKSPSELVFHEKGSWDLGLMPSLEFTNTFRWTLDSKSSLISLEHLRYGIQKPVFLFHLTSYHSQTLQSIDPHLCNEDTYFAHIDWNKEAIHFNLRIIGPGKNDSLHYLYT